MKTERLASLDIVRGMTVAGMILVNNGGRGSFEALRHAPWNGLSLSDLVFPFFLFIMGVSMSLSFGRRTSPRAQRWFKIIKRTVLLFAIGIAINWIELALDGAPLDGSGLRFWAVMQRIAVCYFLASAVALCLPAKSVPVVALASLALYTLLICLGNGYSEVRESNILRLIDEWTVGASHLYRKSAVDPEGLAGTLGSVANVLFGLWCGRSLKAPDMTAKLLPLFTCGSLLAMGGLVLSYALPFNKHIWSPSFALVTSGLCALLLALVMKTVDADRHGGAWTVPFRIFGANALALYISSELISIFCGHFGLTVWLRQGVSAVITVPQLASLTCALTFVLINLALGTWLYRRRIYIKL